jgi:hypothetical protein
VSAIPERRRNRTLAMSITTLLVLAITPLVGWIGVRGVLDSTGGKDALADNLPVQTFPSTPSALYATVDTAGALSSVTVFVLSPTGVGGSIISLPTNADVGFSPDARRSLQTVWAEEGQDGLSFAIESLINIGPNVVSINDPAQAQVFLEPYAPYTVDLVSDVVPDQGENDQQPITKGTAVLDSATAVRVLTAGAGTGVESARQGNLDAFWQAFATSIGGGRAIEAGVDLTVAPPTFDDFVKRFLAAPVKARGLAVKPLTGEDNPTGADVVELDRSDSVFVFASIAPGSIGAATNNPRYRLEAPPGYDLQVKLTIDKLLFLQANVISVDTTADLRADTVFLVPDDADRNRVAVADGIFGTIQYGEPTVRIDGVDVTVVLGTDYLESVET